MCLIIKPSTILLNSLKPIIDLSKGEKMYLVNKAVAIVKLKQPFVDWVNSTEKPQGKLTVEKINRESHIYL